MKRPGALGTSSKRLRESRSGNSFKGSRLGILIWIFLLWRGGRERVVVLSSGTGVEGKVGAKVSFCS